VASAATLLVLLDSVVPILVVDATCFFVAEYIVRFSYGNELVMGSFVSPRVGQRCYWRDDGKSCDGQDLLTDFYPDGTFCSVSDMPS
jgi:hypothetical protein